MGTLDEITEISQFKMADRLEVINWSASSSIVANANAVIDIIKALIRVAIIFFCFIVILYFVDQMTGGAVSNLLVEVFGSDSRCVFLLGRAQEAKPHMALVTMPVMFEEVR